MSNVKSISKKVASLFSILTMVFSMFSVMTVSVSAASYESESNDSYSTANNLSLNSSITGDMSSSSDIDFYKIKVSSNGELTIKFNHTYVDNSSVYWHVNVYYYADGQLKELSGGTIYGTSNESVSFPTIGAVSSGVYYVRIQTNYNATANRNYSISNSFTSTSYYEKEFNDSFATATSMNLNKTYSGYMNSYSDNDFYKITTSSAGKLTIRFIHNYVDNSSVYWHVYIYRYVDGSYTELSSKTIYGSSNESVEFPVVGTVSSGTYYVKVKTNYNATTNYKYSISSSFTSTDYYEKELNNSYATANTVYLNSTYGGYMNSYSDSDFYKLVLSSGATTTFYFNHEHTDSSSVYWRVYVYNYSGGAYNEIASKVIYGDDSESCELFSNKYFSSGTYYVKINTNYDVTTNYEYSIKFSSSTSTTTTYTLSYNANGGSGAPSSQTGKTAYTISSTVPTRSGYTFLGWSKSSSATSASYDAGDSITLTSNTTLYAVWKKNATTTKYTLSYNANGGSGAPSSQSGKTTYTISSTKPTRSGYTFLGWSKSSSATSASYDAGDTITLTSNTTLYAVWEEVNTGNGGDSGDFDFQAIFNAIADFFVWLFNAITSLFA